jgi:hypothetical protein
VIDITSRSTRSQITRRKRSGISRKNFVFNARTCSDRRISIFSLPLNLETVSSDLSKLLEPLQTVVLITLAQGMIDNGGFRYFFETDQPGQPRYKVYSGAYRFAKGNRCRFKWTSRSPDPEGGESATPFPCWRATFLLPDMTHQAVPRHIAKEINARHSPSRKESAGLVTPAGLSEDPEY